MRYLRCVSTGKTSDRLDAPASDDTILGELVEMAQTHQGRCLAQFRSRSSAHQYARLYTLVRHHVARGAKVLDWGVANGHFSYFLLRAGYEAYGYSLEDLTFEPLLHSSPYRFVKGSDPVTLPFDDAVFDAVVSVGVLEHVKETGGNELASLREIGRTLRPGGSLICYHLPNRHSWIEWVARHASQHKHTYRYGRAEIERLVVEAGLELRGVSRYGALPRNSLGQLPVVLRPSARFARAYDAADAVLAGVLAPVCQNYWFVACRRS